MPVVGRKHPPVIVETHDDRFAGIERIATRAEPQLRTQFLGLGANVGHEAIHLGEIEDAAAVAPRSPYG